MSQETDTVYDLGEVAVFSGTPVEIVDWLKARKSIVGMTVHLNSSQTHIPADQYTAVDKEEGDGTTAP